jgi:hypothetical protein
MIDESRGVLLMKTFVPQDHLIFPSALIPTSAYRDSQMNWYSIREVKKKTASSH